MLFVWGSLGDCVTLPLGYLAGLSKDQPYSPKQEKGGLQTGQRCHSCSNEEEIPSDKGGEFQD